MWTLPGYGEHLEQGSPGLREQMTAMGAPEGFIDVVAALNPIAADDSDVPAHWSVTFAVDDADASAAKASELGGEIVAGPFDAPWTRMAVIKDPYGATFIASQFVLKTRISKRSRTYTTVAGVNRALSLYGATTRDALPIEQRMQAFPEDGSTP